MRPEKTSKPETAWKNKHNKRFNKHYNFWMSKENDSEVIEKLDNQTSMTNYIRTLVLNDIKENGMVDSSTVNERSGIYSKKVKGDGEAQ